MWVIWKAIVSDCLRVFLAHFNSTVSVHAFSHVSCPNRTVHKLGRHRCPLACDKVYFEIWIKPFPFSVLFSFSHSHNSVSASALEAGKRSLKPRLDENEKTLLKSENKWKQTKLRKLGKLKVSNAFCFPVTSMVQLYLEMVWTCQMPCATSGLLFWDLSHAAAPIDGGAGLRWNFVCTR